MVKILLKRIYEEPSEADGYRILLDRLWPRGLALSSRQRRMYNIVIYLY